MDIILPTPDVLLVTHELVLDFSGGKQGIHDAKILDGAIARPLTYIQYVDDYDVDTICALLIDSIARNHGFNDGNKRTALMTAILTYRMNKISFVPSIEMNIAFDDLVMWVVTEKPTIEAIAQKLKELREEFEGEARYIDTINSFFTMLRAKGRHNEK